METQNFAAMTPKEALEAAIDAAGSQSALAQTCGCTQGAIWQMLNRADPRLSHRYVLKVEAATGIPRWALRPDIYPRECAEPLVAAGGR